MQTILAEFSNIWGKLSIAASCALCYSSPGKCVTSVNSPHLIKVFIGVIMRPFIGAKENESLFSPSFLGGIPATLPLHIIQTSRKRQ